MVKLINCFTISAFQVQPVFIEVALTPQLPAFALVGLASSVTQESRERVRSAVCQSGFEWPQKKITINLKPAELPKWGTHFELPMAIGVLTAKMPQLNQVEEDENGVPPVEAALNEDNASLFSFGKLSLSGEVEPCGFGAALNEWWKNNPDKLPDFIMAHPMDLSGLSFPPDVSVIPVLDLKQAVKLWKSSMRHWKKTGKKTRNSRVGNAKQTENERQASLDQWEMIRDEPLAVFAALVALIDRNLHFLLAGPHGTGKSMVASAVAAAQGALSEKHIGERALIQLGVHGSVDSEKCKSRPAIRLQTSMSRAALEGSVQKNGQAMPGELTRAHGGLLLMDELLEYRRDVIECLRQPLEEGIVRIQRSQFKADLPADFQLLATTNLCPCGYFGHPRIRCQCTVQARQHYLRKLSGPLLDRFDMVVLTGQKNFQSRVVPALQQRIERYIHNAKRGGINYVTELSQRSMSVSQTDAIDGPNTVWGTESQRVIVKQKKLAMLMAHFDERDKCIEEDLALARTLRFDIFHGLLHRS